MSALNSDLKKGALVNTFGVVGKLAAPMFLILVNRLFGADVFGIYITAAIAIDILLAFLTTGFKDGAMIFVSRHAEDEEKHGDLYTSLANAFTWSIGGSALIVLFGIYFGKPIFEFAYGEEFSKDLLIILQYMLFSLPFMAFDRIVLASTQGLKIMKYDAISSGWLRPIILLVASFIFWIISADVKGMGLAFLATQIIMFLIALWIYQREFNWGKLFESFRSFKVNKELIDFAIPQSLNMTLNRFITGIDVLMLPAFGFSEVAVGFYGAGSMIVREVRSIKFIFSTAFSPFIVRLHEKENSHELSTQFSKTSGLIATLTIPVLLMIALFKDEILLLVQPEFTGSTLFVLFLLLIPYFYCSFSLAGNIVAMTGHSKLNLMNSIIVSVSNIILNIILIPKFGLVGAALASGVSMFILTIIENIEAWKVASARLKLSDMIRPHLSGFLSFISLLFLHEQVLWFQQGLINQIVLGTIVLLIFMLGTGSEFLIRAYSRIK